MTERRITYFATERRTFMGQGLYVPEDATPEEIQAACEEDWNSDDADLSETQTVFDWEGKPSDEDAIAEADWELITCALDELRDQRAEEAALTDHHAPADAEAMRETSRKAALLALKIARGVR